MPAGFAVDRIGAILPISLIANPGIRTAITTMIPAPSIPARHCLSRGKRATFFLLGVLLSAGLTDFFAALLLILRFGFLPTMEEISARTIDGIPSHSGNQAPFAATLHPYVGYVHTPLSIPRTIMSVQSARVEFDESNEVTATLGAPTSTLQPTASRWGYLDKHSPLCRRSPDTLIVGILGGSVAEGLSVEGAERLASQLSLVDRFAGKRIRLVTLAIQGFKQPQQLLTITYLLSLGGQFDVLVNIDGFNELFISIVQNYERGVTPTHPMLWDVRMQASADVDHLTIGRLAYARQHRADVADFFIQYPWRTSSLAKCAWLFWDGRLSRHEADVLRNITPAATTRKNESATGPFEVFASDDELYRHCVDVWKRSSMQLHHLCNQHDIAYYHFLQPNQYVPGSKPMAAEESETAVTPGSPFERVVRKGYPLLTTAGAELEAEGVKFHSLADVFLDHHLPVYKDNCCHVTEEGSNLMADAIARFVSARP